MKKVIVTCLALLISVCSTVFAAEPPLLAPIDPLAWAVANADWGPYGGAQIEALRKIVNGQVAAHQVNSSYTDPVTRVVKRIKCYDPANCVMCSKEARDSARTLRVQITNSASNAQGISSVYGAMETYAKSRADAMGNQARWNSLKNENTITEVTSVDGQDVTTTKTVKVENSADAELLKTKNVMEQIRQAAQMQQQQQGSLVYTYIAAAAGLLKEPEPATELDVGKDPLQ